MSPQEKNEIISEPHYLPNRIRGMKDCLEFQLLIFSNLFVKIRSVAFFAIA